MLFKTAAASVTYTNKRPRGLDTLLGHLLVALNDPKLNLKT